MVRWKDLGQSSIPTERNQDNCELIGKNDAASDGDKVGVQKLYPWRGSWMVSLEID